ncbi:Uncharacterized protein OBRU01_01234 [Operophtera brumata]|uniref:Uncharacterized protein n=1 Tax=Operophtera brumata TaxID=104452 RepID=A0A0L7LUH0_OPEBR|nr:Uncharacterized protein OBRU01_01234 [Operophtera brumata]
MFLFQGYATYFGVGLGISLARVILPQIRSPTKAIASIRGKHFKLALFFGSYIGIYRLYSTILYEKKILPTNIPLPELLYCIFQGTLFNARIMQPETCPSYVFNLMKSVSNGRLENLNI